MRFLCLTLVAIASVLQYGRALTYRAADISSLVVVEQAGVHYTDNGQTKAFESIIVSHGANAARVRVWTAGQYSLSYAIALGRRVKVAGMTLVVDLHFSDTCTRIYHRLDARLELTYIRVLLQGLTLAISLSRLVGQPPSAA